MLMSEVLAFSGGQQQGRPQTTKSTAKAFEAGTLLGALMQVCSKRLVLLAMRAQFSSLVDPGVSTKILVGSCIGLTRSYMHGMHAGQQPGRPRRSSAERCGVSCKGCLCNAEGEVEDMGSVCAERFSGGTG
eukprot:scaffold178271_cov22-Tisochrysis_lutea.AAC.2